MITVCVPLFDPHKWFLPHFVEWYADNKEKHGLNKSWAWRRPLHHAQAMAVSKARKSGSSHILFVEDDHWGFPENGLDVLLEADKEVIGFQTVSRNYPYHSLAMRRMDKSLAIDQTAVRNMQPVTWREGEPVIQQVDLISWAFTLVRLDVFDRIDNPFTYWGEVPTDSIFAKHCEAEGIPRNVHFGAIIPHGDVHPSEIYVLQRLEQLRRRLRGESVHPTGDADERQPGENVPPTVANGDTGAGTPAHPEMAGVTGNGDGVRGAARLLDSRPDDGAAEVVSGL